MVDHEEVWKRRCQVTVNGSQTLSKRAEAFLQPYYPKTAEGAKGCYLFAEGDQYIDLNGALGAVTIGYGNPRCLNNLYKEIVEGVSLSLPTKIEEEAANIFVERCMWIDQVRFVKTGSEANEAAIRIARIATQREQILFFKHHYHGWHAQFQYHAEYHEGIPRHSFSHFRTFPATKEDLHFLEEDLKSKQYAAIILEPAHFQFTPTDKMILSNIRKMCSDNGTLLIFDEVLTGFRFSTFGIAELSDIHPDLSTYGKCLAQGLPLACVAGREEIMQHSWVVSGTFGGDRVALKALLNTFDFYEKNGVCEALHNAGNHLKQYLRAYGKNTIGLQCEGDGPRLCLSMDEAKGKHGWYSFLVGCLRAGLFLHPSGINMMYESSQQKMLNEIEEGFSEAIEFVEAGGLTQEEMEVCQGPQPAWREQG